MQTPIVLRENAVKCKKSDYFFIFFLEMFRQVLWKDRSGGK